MTQWQCIDKSDLQAILSVLQEKRNVFAPVEQGNDLRLRMLPAEGKIFLGSRKPLLPLKMLFLPEVEDLFSISIKNTSPHITPVEPITRDRLVLGVLGCDIAALEILDRVFLEEPVDESYRKRREQTTLIAMACTGEGSECFCTSLGIDPLQPNGADAVLAEQGETYLLKPLTKKGEHIAEELQEFLKEAAGSRSPKEILSLKYSRGDVPVDRVSKEPGKLWDLPVWDDLSALCLGCGVCTVLCPTCHCFDVEDERRGSSGKRFRAWDSCMSACFTRMASGENPRPTKRERVRQRFLHKLCYFPREKGIVGCVGCGRCSVHCPVSIRIDEVIVELAWGDI